jgi:ElaB/YqjD/DUF883 family membrane-anchored ribosome-binding protein
LPIFDKGTLMENSTTGNFAKTGQALADKAQSIRGAHDTVKDVGTTLSSKLEDVCSEAGTAVNRGSKRAQSMSKQGLDKITDMAGQAGDMASDATESIVAYTKKNPVMALGMAAAAGALLYAAIKALSPSRD